MDTRSALSPAHRALIDDVGRILAAGRDGIDVKAMLKAARASGLLQPRELQTLETHGRPPGWLLDALGLSADYAPSVSFKSVRASSGRRWRLTPPAALNAAVLPSPFQVDRGRSPDVDVVSGEDADLVLNTRAKACFLADGYVPGLTDVENLWTWARVRERPARHLQGRSLILYVEGSHLLSHWLLDTLPRLGALSAAGRSLADYDQIVVSSVPQPFHAQTLETLGVAREKLITRAEAGPRLRCDAFDYVTAVRQGYVAEPWVYAFVEQAFGAAAAAAPFRKLFVSRDKARRRRIVDEAALHPILEARGYQIVYAEDHSLREMAQLCAEATAIAGPHGAGVANAVFARPGARVLEIFGAHLSTEYWRLAGQRGLAYACFQARDGSGRDFDAAEVAHMGVLERKVADMSVPPEELARVLDDFEAL